MADPSRATLARAVRAFGDAVTSARRARSQRGRDAAALARKAAEARLLALAARLDAEERAKNRTAHEGNRVKPHQTSP